MLFINDRSPPLPNLCCLPCAFTAQKVEELEEALKKKDEDMKQMEERYKKYLEKAKSVNISTTSANVIPIE